MINIEKTHENVGLSVQRSLRKGDQRPFFIWMGVNGGEASLPGKQLFRENGLFNESTAFWLIYNIFYTKQ